MRNKIGGHYSIQLKIVVLLLIFDLHIAFIVFVPSFYYNGSCTWFFINECTSSKEATWIECGGSSTASQYLASFYWTTATLIGVGYGSNIPADSNAERAFALVTEVS